jgi:transcriptional regulator with XRE-family HTH domain
MDSYEEALQGLGQRARTLRLYRALQQREVAERAGIGLGTVIRFEHTGRASTENVLRIAGVLAAEEGFDKLFELPKYRSLDEALGVPGALKRRRVRRKRIES